MTLILTITNVDRLENNSSTRLVLDRHGAQIGRSPTADWSLPDPKHYISSNHCDIDYDYMRGQYMLTDRSTNGTFVNGSQERLSGPYKLADGDELTIGHYRIRVRLAEDGAESEPPKPQPAPASNGWDWDNAAEPRRENPAWDSPLEDSRAPHRWSFEPPPVEPRREPEWNLGGPAAAITGRGAASENFAPPRPLPESSGGDVWGRFADHNRVDWERGGFAQERSPPSAWMEQAPAPPQAAPWPAAPSSQPPPWPTAPAPQAPQAPPWPPAAAPHAPQTPWAAAPAHQSPQAAPWPTAPASQAPPPVAPQYRPPVPETSPTGGGEWAALLRAAGVDPAEIRVPPSQSATAAGLVLKKLIAGLVLMLDARARAKRELGAESTMFEPQGNNPLKFLRSPEVALAKLLNPPEPRCMDSEHAVEDAFKDLQAHQMATLAAMQGALRATLTRFSPEAIRSRATARGLLARIIPGAAASALWEAYEREFEGVVKGSDEAFMDVFAKAFREAYQKACTEMRR